MAKDRDRRHPIIPPAHVRAQTEPGHKISPPAPSELAAVGEADVDAAAEDALFETVTPVTSDPFVRIEHRQRRTSLQVGALRGRLGKLEVQQQLQHQGLSKEIAGISTKTDVILESIEADKKTREDRAETARLERKAAEDREERRLDRVATERKTNRKLIAGIAVPSITAILTGIAVIIASCRDRPVAVAPTPPASVSPAAEPTP